ncbi:GspE/PulE family protein [Capillibacterium thermochitinicola]|uniref:GspE/PulE family protein n=1 Tax=Capillibacterium thermochitinicola TaxID=2699427 RepID=UPI001E4B153D|nr:GspE/PulE family protein [Capillibacterium thermochitinicola]
MTENKIRYFGEILINKGLITQEQLERALKRQKEDGRYLGEILVAEGILTEEDVIETLVEQQGLPLARPADETIPPEVINCITPKQAHEYRVIPIAKGENSITVACADPFATIALDNLRRELGVTIKLAITTKEQIERGLEKYYHERLHNVSAILENLTEAEMKNLVVETFDNGTAGDLENLANEAPIVRLVNFLIAEGIRLKASDIHLQPFEKEVKLRYRIDGVLYERNAPPRNLYAAIISRLKLMAGMDITERRLPQDGRIRFMLGDKELDLRVAVVPVLHGESAVIRILNHQGFLLDLGVLGMDGLLDQFERLINISHGMILVTGPTGSGKTTTLYAVLARLNRPERKIITIEDPVEYEMIGIDQIPVNPKLNFGFAQGLRTVIRHDPDIILVGEIRDRETAEVAVQSALTGHLVFSTLHTNNAAATYTRLVDIGIEPYLVASTVKGVLAQRLVRRICPACRVEYTPSAAEREILAEISQPPARLYRGTGCEECNYIGYKGRLGLFELLITSEQIEKLIMANASTSQIKKVAIAEGMKTLREDGWDKVRAGLTTLEEVLRVTQE